MAPMSPMSDPRLAGQPAQPSQEEMRAYLEQLREADAAGLVAEAFNLLATGAQVKLGRADARVLIDALAAMVEASAATMPQQITEQMKQGIAQLQLAQVQAEKDMAAEQEAQQSGEGTSTSDAATDASQPSGSAAPQPGASGANQRMTDRLWVPGR